MSYVRESHPHDDLDYERDIIAISAERVEVYAATIRMMLDVRDDDRAQAAREALAKEVGVINQHFTDLGKALSTRPRQAAAAHFAHVGTKDHRQQETDRHRFLDRDAEADADAAAAR